MWHINLTAGNEGWWNSMKFQYRYKMREREKKRGQDNTRDEALKIAKEKKNKWTGEHSTLQ